MFLPVDAPLKATPEMDFAHELMPLIKDGKQDDVRELFAALTSARRMVLWALDRDRTTVTTDDMLERVREYAALLRGFSSPPEGASSKGSLRRATSFVWRDLLDVKGRDWRMSDVSLEEASVLLAASQNLLSKVARETLNASNAVDVHATLRKTAGLLAEARKLATDAETWHPHDEEDDADAEDDDEETVVAEIAEDPEKSGDDVVRVEAQVVPKPPPEPKPPKKGDSDDEKKKDTTEEKTTKKGSWFGSSFSSKKKKKKEKIEGGFRSSTDLRLALPEAWAHLALAEAQTATLSRACAQPHIEWSLIASLCADQVDRYGRGVDGHVEALIQAAPDAANLKEWAGKRVSHAFLKSHVETKTLYFSAISRYCVGAPLLELAVRDTNDTMCSQALAELGAALAFMKEAQAASSKFLATSRPITYVQDPTQTLQDSHDLIKRAYDRALQLDSSIFHRGPSELGPFPERKSLITAVPCPDPGKSPLWTRQAWDAFDQAKLPENPPFGVASDSRDCCLIS